MLRRVLLHVPGRASSLLKCDIGRRASLADSSGSSLGSGDLGGGGPGDFAEEPVVRTGADGTLTSANGTTDEYGNPRDTSTIGQRRYGWLGTKQRAADTPGGLTLMGVRLYNPTTGRFLSTDRSPEATPTPTSTAAATASTATTSTAGGAGGRGVLERREGELAKWQYRQVGRRRRRRACVVLSAGACGIAAGVAFGVSFASRTHKFVRTRSYRRAGGWTNYTAGVAGDALFARMPGIRYAKRVRVYRPRHGLANHGTRTRYQWHSLRGALRTRRGRWNAVGIAGSAAWSRWS
jgi:hypothetical protein